MPRRSTGLHDTIERHWALAPPRRVAVLALAVGFSPRRAAAQASPPPVQSGDRDTAAATGRPVAYRSRILGVFDETTGAPVDDAQVLDLATGWSAKTTSTGTVSLSFLANGGSIVRVRKVGYAPLVVPIAISPRDTAPLTLVMTELVELPGVVTHGTPRKFLSPALNGFAERAENHASGYFITDSVLRRDENRPVGNVVRSRLPGAYVKDGPGGAMYLVASMRCSVGGAPEVYLDGVPVNAEEVTASGSSRSILFNLNSINVSDLAGIEYYPSTEGLPIEFSHTTQGCGALLLWTRER